MNRTSLIKVTMNADVFDPIEVVDRRGRHPTYVVYPVKMHEDMIRRMLEHGFKQWINDCKALGLDTKTLLRRAHTGKTHWTIRRDAKRYGPIFVAKRRIKR